MLLFSELLRGGTTFTVNFDDQLREPESLYNSSQLDFANFHNLDLQDDDTYTPGDSFDNLRKKMENLTPDGKIMKRIIRTGYGSPPPQYSQVKIDYNGFIEFQDEPFDSTYLRRKPFQFVLNKGGTLPGLEYGVSTMLTNEKSQFIIHPDYAYGKMGCLERIPANSHILFEVEMKEICDIGAAVNYKDVTDEQKKDFKTVYDCALALCVKGNELFKRNQYKIATKEYNSAISDLEYVEVPNNEDLEKQRTLLLRLYTNNAIAYTKLKLPKKACINCNNAFALVKGTSLKIPAKLYYNNALSLIELNDLTVAENRLKKAQQLAPENAEISALFKKLDEMKREKIESEKKLAQRIFSPQNKTVQLSEEFKALIHAFLKEFMKSDKSSEEAPNKLQSEELAFLRDEASKMGLKLVKCPGGEEKYLIEKSK